MKKLRWALLGLLPLLLTGAAPTPGPGVPTPTGTLVGIAPFFWNGTAWAPQGAGGVQNAAAPAPGATVPTATGTLAGVAPFYWNGAAWVPQNPQPTIAVQALCDGTTDDTAAFTAAIATEPATGARLSVPPGVCIISSSILLPNATVLTGQGKSVTTLKMKQATNINPMIGNVTQGGSFIEVRNLSLDGNKAQNGAGTSQGLHFVQLSNATLDNIEVHHVNGIGISLDGNGDNTSRGDVVHEVYTHDNDLNGFSVTFAQRQTAIVNLRSMLDGSAGNPNFPCIFLDASEEQVTGVLADQCKTNGIHIHNVMASRFANLTATRSQQHGIFIEELNSSTGSNWTALNSSAGTANTWDDVHFGNGTVGYGISKNSVIAGVTVGPEAQLGTSQDRYALYVEDNINTNLQVMNVNYTGAGSTGTARLPATPGGLVVRPNVTQIITASSGTIGQLGTHLKLSGWGAGGFGGNGLACGAAASCSGGAGGGGAGRFATDWIGWGDLGVTSCTAAVGQPLANGAALSGGLTTVTCGSYVFSAFAGGGGQNGASAAGTGGGGGGNPCGAGSTGAAAAGGGAGGNTCGGAVGGSAGAGVGDVTGQGAGGAGSVSAAAGVAGGNEAVGGTSGGGSGGGCNAGAAAAGGNGGKTAMGQVTGSAVGIAGVAGLSAGGVSGMGGSGGGSAITSANGGTGGHGALPGGGGGGGGDTCNAGSGTIGAGGTSGGGEVIAQQ